MRIGLATSPCIYGVSPTPFDPATLSPDLWFKAFAGSPWLPTAPGNTHGNLVGNATAPSVLSPGVNSIDVARFNGTTQSLKLSTAYNVYLDRPTGFTLVAFVRLVGAQAANGAAFYDEPPIFTDETGNWAFVATTGGVRVGIWAGSAAHTTRIPLAAGDWAMTAIRYKSADGFARCRVSQLSGTTDQAVATAAITGVGAELRLGKNYTGSVFLPFDCAEALGWQRVLSNSDLDDLKGYFNARFNQGLT